MITLGIEDILLKQHYSDKKAAITAAGKKLVEQGYVTEDYIEKMIERDSIVTTYIGNMVAIPHGTEDANRLINKSGIVILQVPEGVMFDGNQVKMIIGIAGIENQHLELLSQIAVVCSDVKNVEQLISAQSAAEIIKLFKEEVPV